jgi:hypothetical protein
MDQLQTIAKGKTVCKCGNNDWHQLLFAGSPPRYIGGCRLWGRTYANKPESWVNRARRW